MMPDPYILEAIDAAAAKHAIDRNLLIAVAHVETGGSFNPEAVSPKGAAGLFQIMPATARSLKVNPLDPAEAADGAARFLKSLRRKFGSWELALAGYNWGPANIEKYGDDRDRWPPETKNYVVKVFDRWKKKILRFLNM